jgi:hypothetical protein
MRDARYTPLGLPALAIVLATLAPTLLESRGQAPPKSRATPTAAKAWTQPRTPWGDPDLQGVVWNFATMVPFERPANFAGKEVLTDEEAAAFEKQTNQGRANGQQTAGPDWWDPGMVAMKSRQTSLVVDPPNGRLPAQTPEAQQRAAARNQARRAAANTENPEDLALNVRCILYGSAGPPMVPGVYNNNIVFAQTPGYIAIINEMIHDTRIIPMDGRPHGSLRQLLGDSRGHWEGNTLVVDTINFTDKSAFRGSTENLHLVERFTRVDENTVDYRYSVDDPHTWTASWTADVRMVKENGLMYEYACHEGNYLSMVGILTVARGQDKAQSAR